MENITRRSVFSQGFALTTIFAFIYIFYYSLDPKDFLDQGVFPWDSATYRSLAGQFSNGDLYNLSGTYPFATRILFPFLYGRISNLFGFSYAEAAHILNIIASLFVFLFSYFYWIGSGIKFKYAIFSIIIFGCFYLGPLRYSIYYPGGGFAFEAATVCALYLLMLYVQKLNSLNIISALFAFFTVVILSLSREIVLFTILGYLLVLFKYRNKGLNEINNITRFIFLLFFAAVVFVCLRIFIANVDGGYSLLDTALSFSWYHLNIGELSYPFYYSLGPFFMVLIISLITPRIRNKVCANILSQKYPLLYLTFIGMSFLFCFAGGTDSDRFLLWFFPFWVRICVASFQIIEEEYRISVLIKIAIFVISIFWARMYVPAIPNLIYTGDKFNAHGGFKTDLSESNFYGPTFLKIFRQPLREVSQSEFKTEGIWVDNIDLFNSKSGSISSILNPEKNTLNFHRGSYRLEMNNIPFPLGFPHNQFELLASHPYHGSFKIKVFILFEWIAVSFIFYFLLLRKPNENFRRSTHRV